MNKQNGLFFIFLSSLLFGSYGIWSRLIGSSFDPFFQGWTRGLLIVLILFPFLWYQKQIVPIAKKDYLWLCTFLIFTSFTQAPLFYAFNHMDIGSATLLFFVSMLITMYLVGILFLKEKITKIKVVSFIFAAIGLYTVFSFSLVFFSLLAAGMAILNGVASGGEVSSSKKLSEKYSPLYICWLSWFIIFLTNAPISIFLGETQHVPALNLAWLYQIGYTLSSLFGFWLIIKGLKYVEASIGGLVGLLEIVWSILFAMLIFHEELSRKIIIGALLILVAAALPHVTTIVQKLMKRKMF